MSVPPLDWINGPDLPLQALRSVTANNGEDLALRTPQEILDEIDMLDAESPEILEQTRDFCDGWL